MKIENVVVSDRDEGLLYVRDLNKTLKVITMLTDEDIKEIQKMLDAH